MNNQIKDPKGKIQIELSKPPGPPWGRIAGLLWAGIGLFKWVDLEKALPSYEILIHLTIGGVFWIGDSLRRESYANNCYIKRLEEENEALRQKIMDD